MTTIAGIRIPDSALAREMLTLVQDTSPEFLVRHCQRTYVLGAMAVTAAGLEFDTEVAYLAALFHDLGLTDRYRSDQRFEVGGATAAREWARSNGLSDDRAQMIWDAIALHTSVGIADRRSAECALVHWGAGTDIAGIGLDRFDPTAIAAVVAELPRDGLTEGFADLIEAAVRRSPSAYAMTWLTDFANRCCGGGLPSVAEAILARCDPWGPPQHHR